MSVPPPPSTMWPTTTHPPFTVSQWQELEHQALIFKYLKAGLSVPPDLLLPIRKSLQFISHHSSSLGYYGKKIDPEPGRCRRTDGKKWRCSRDAHPDSKYCDRHMIRRRYRSRKPVESSSSSSQSQSQSSSSVSSTSQLVSSIGTTTASTGSVSVSVSATSNSTFHTLPLHTNGTREGLGFTLGNTIPHMDPMLLPLQGSKKPYRFGLNSEADEHNLLQKDLGTVKYQGYDFTSDGMWYNNMSQIPSNTVSESRSGSTTMAGNYFQQRTTREPELFSLDAARSKEIVFNNQLCSTGSLKQDYQSPQSLFSDWHWKKDLASSAAIGYRPNKDFNTDPDANVDSNRTL